MSSSFELGNGFLSYANPNYQRVPSDENCNVEIDDLYEELNGRINHKTGVRSRRKYANLEPSSMGVDLHLESENSESSKLLYSGNGNSEFDSNENKDTVKRSSFLDYYLRLEASFPSDSDPSSRSCRSMSDKLCDSINFDDCSFENAGDYECLPTGWEKHEDDSGPYYWHISSGTIQRDPPLSLGSSYKISTGLSKDLDMVSSKEQHCFKTCSTFCSNNVLFSAHSEEEKLKRRSCPGDSGAVLSDKRPIRFAVRSLGWVEIAEADLTPERSSKAVNKCIVDLSVGRNDILDVVGRWGDGKDLYMDLDDYSLRLMDSQDLTVLNTQSIHTIRVWGVGRDNGRERDFAYVARDRVTKKYMCHVFRCDIPARIIANTLRDICKKIMIERSVQRGIKKQSSSENMEVKIPARPTDLPVEQGLFPLTESQSSCSGQLFPTPMEEPKKVLKVFYLGSTNVDKATGVDVLNEAIEKLFTAIPKSDYKFVNVAVAPSTITICEENKQLAECRVRFLSFLGIGKSVKMCGFIVHTAQDDFIAHVFFCEPSSGALCKTIEAACKLRYQKCLDARRQSSNINTSGVKKKDIKAALKNVFGTFFPARMRKSAET
nr:protein Fe65 homolog isoform X1 [Parasteatoda tepidariorum]XP_042895772.1 protein Fe65 homolog isoform X1 [Parasteatoda tepidariorum]